MSYEIVDRNYRFLNIPSGDLRISITDDCNMQCRYCHNEGQSGSIAKHYLSHDEIISIIDRAMKYGVVKVRLTGGEPLLHPDIELICKSIRERYNIRNLGINTNAYNGDRLIKMCHMNLLDQIVIGVDFFANTITKDSSVGPSPKYVLSIARELKKQGHNIQIASVYMGDDSNKIKLIDYCLEHEILVKIIEMTNMERKPDNSYFDFVKKVISHFDLKVGLTVDLNQLYGIKNDKQVIRFFQSHCNRGECLLCRNLHLRITSTGYAKPCLFNKYTEEYLLNPRIFDTNIRRAIINMGNSYDV